MRWFRVHRLTWTVVDVDRSTRICSHSVVVWVCVCLLTGFTSDVILPSVSCRATQSQSSSTWHVWYACRCLDLADGCCGVSDSTRRSLRSAEVPTCVVPGYGHRTSASAVPRLWNSLSVQLRNPDITPGLFRRQIKGKATGNSRSGITGNSRESRTPKFPAGIPGNFWKYGGNYGEFREFCLFFTIFIVDYDILVLLSKTLNDVFDPTF